MVLDPLLTSSYLQYKLDTNNVATWLARTAQLCGYPADLLNSYTPQSRDRNQAKPLEALGGSGGKGGGRLKGKARKAAKTAAAAQVATPPTTPSSSNRTSKASSPPRPPANTYILPLKEFISTAEYIAAHDKKREVQVSETFAVSLQRAIERRKSFGEQIALREQNRKENKPVTVRHNYFIGVLEHVRDVLKPLMPQSFKADANAADPEKLANQFEKLRVYEPSEEFLNAPDVTIPSAADKKTPTDRYEAEVPDIKEAYFVFHLLLSDLAKMRTVIEDTWQRYKVHIIDIATAALTTNTAVGIARRMVEDAMPVLEPHGGCEGMMHTLYGLQCEQAGEDPEFKGKPDDFFNMRMYDTCEAMLWPTFQILESFCASAFGKASMWQVKPGMFGTYNPRLHRDRMDNRSKAREDKALLMKALGDFTMLSNTTTEPMMFEDEIINGMREALHTTNRVPLWLTFAVQLYIDVHYVLRTEVSRGFDLHKMANIIKDSIQTTLDYHEGARPEGWPKSNEKAFKVVIDKANFVNGEDPVYAIKRQHTTAGGAGKPFDWLKSHPMFAGLYLFHLKALFQEVGIGFANAWGGIMYCGHFYNAMNYKTSPKVRWDDMDVLMMLQKDFFVGDTPKTPEDFLKRFALSMGVSASFFAKNKRANRGGKVTLSPRGPRGLQLLAPVSMMFRDRYCEPNGRRDLSTADLKTILEKGMWEVNEEESKEMNAAAAKKGDTGADFHVFARNEDPAATRKRLENKQCTPSKLLTALRDSVMAEWPEFTFNYMTMHRMCWIMLTSLHGFVKADLSKMFGPRYIENETQLPLMIGYIFGAAAAADQVNKTIRRKGEPFFAHSELFMTAGGTVAYFLEKDFFRKQTLNEIGLPVRFEEDED
ncbi:hypothetical protein KEM56_001808 [Ascosphaera pollenicola]|nr:hypothetical protein KEM56_001808 [Ascosphaera pollenicola]